jgi:alpha-1,2-mannosyltransferase
MLGAWRIRRLAIAAAVAQAIVLAFMVAGTHGWLVAGVGPTTTDYVSFWAAGKLADQGRPQAAYDHDAHLRVEEAATAPGIKYQFFFNPPPYLLIMAPFARLPYLVSFVLFQILTLSLWLVLGTRAAGGGSTAALCLMAVPSLWWVLGLGQNSFLSASLMAGGLLLLPRRGWLAGVAFGLLCYKPHLGLLIPVALVAGGQWRTAIAATLTVTAIVAATVGVFGVQTWTAYLHGFGRDLGAAIDSGQVLLAGRVDPTGAAQELGLGIGAARIVWVLCLTGAAGCVALVWRRGSADVRNAVLAACVVLAAPFALFYDLVMCSLAACFLVRAGRRDGFLPGEAPALAGVCVVNLLATPLLVTAVHIPFGAVVAPTLLGLALRRWRRDLAA